MHLHTLQKPYVPILDKLQVQYQLKSWAGGSLSLHIHDRPSISMYVHIDAAHCLLQYI